MPTPFRNRIVGLAHDMPMAGQLGVAIASDCISQSFYCPGFDGDVRRYCASCDSRQCHASAKVKKARLQCVPIVEVPFKKVAVDIIGPLKWTTDRGHKYVLTVMDYSTHYAEAVS